MALASLYVKRNLENSNALIEWAKAQGFPVTQRSSAMHTTIAYSKAEVEWPEMHDNGLVIRTLVDRTVERLGDAGAVVLKFQSATLTARWKELCDAGCSWDYDGFTPHVTISWEVPDDFDLSEVEPYKGELVFGPEVFQEVDEGWRMNHTEKALSFKEAFAKVGARHTRQEFKLIQDAHDGIVKLGARCHDNNVPGLDEVEKRENPTKTNPNHDEAGRFSEGSGGGGGGGDGGASASAPGKDRQAKVLRAELSAWKLALAHARARSSGSSLERKEKEYKAKIEAVEQKLRQLEVGKDFAEVRDGAVSDVVRKFTVAKVDKKLGVVFGWAIVSKEDGEEYFDKQGDHIPEDAMLNAATDFMLGRRMMKIMHEGNKKGTVVFAWPMTTEIAEAMNVSTLKTGLMIGVKPDDKSVLDKFASGEYKGFSIGGSRVRDDVVED